MHSSSRGKSHNFLQKLFFRELTGEFRKCGSRQREKPFNQLPSRLAFKLSDIAPLTALASGHIFLGFTKCGQFLLSYTHTSDTDENTVQLVHRYRLHYWLFVPHQKLKKVAEVMLFGDQDLQTSLCEEIHISVCQWPNDLSRILVYGCSFGGDDVIGSQTGRIHVTISALPSLNGCRACYQVSTEYCEEDIAERWNSCIRFSCLKHGITVHFNYEFVPPFPRFMPTVQMKRKGCIVLNAGNFIHVVSVSLENLDKKPVDAETEIAIRRSPKSSVEPSHEFMSPVTMNPPSVDSDGSANVSVNYFDEDMEPNSLRISSCDIKNCSVDRDREWEILIASVPKTNNCDISVKGYEKSSGSTQSYYNDTDSESGNSQAEQTLPEYPVEDFSPCQVAVDVLDSDDSVAFSHCTDEEKSIEPNPRKNKVSFTSRPKATVPRGSEYEFIDEITESSHEKLSTFRRRRLAEKKYEFSDENSENVPQHYRFFRSRNLLNRSSRLRAFPMSDFSSELGEASDLLRSVYERILSPSSGGASPNDVLRPINQNIASPILSPRDDRLRDNLDKWDKADLQNWSSRESLSINSPNSYALKQADPPSTATNSSSFNCIADIERRYIELDDEMVSVITEIEDDELSTATGYHNALPVVVHGSGYTQMHMISNSKAGKLNVPGALVKQVSLDVEQLCHETAQKLCAESGKKYFFCNDYNVDIIDVCPDTGNVIAVASVLLQAGNAKTKLAKNKSISACGQPTRKVYKGTTIFLFDVVKKTYNILDSYPLVEQNPYNLNGTDSSRNDDTLYGEWWEPDRALAKKIRSDWANPTDYISSVKVMTNEPLITGKSLTHIIEGHHLVALILEDLSPRVG